VAWAGDVLHFVFIHLDTRVSRLPELPTPRSDWMEQIGTQPDLGRLGIPKMAPRYLLHDRDEVQRFIRDTVLAGGVNRSNCRRKSEFDSYAGAGCVRLKRNAYQLVLFGRSCCAEQSNM
jgi:hypothetical protein